MLMILINSFIDDIIIRSYKNWLIVAEMCYTRLATRVHVSTETIPNEVSRFVNIS